MENIRPNDFLEQALNGIIVDVRTPAEFACGHIPKAINVPLFSDEERVVVGTIYKKQSKEKAIEKGLDLVGIKLGDFVRTIRKHIRAVGLPPETVLYLYCWRGGMRSNSMAWLFSTTGFNVKVLRGGYKAYRASFIDKLNKNRWKYLVLGGPTGCGKTYILEELRNLGEQVVDLEGLAKHRGSAFGNWGHTEPQPTSEHFTNLVYDALLKCDPNRAVWCEGESMSIGRVFMPQELHRAIQNSEMMHFSMTTECRLDHIMKDYGSCPKEDLVHCFTNITKRLGYDNAKRAIEHIEQDDIRSAAAIALIYYDKTYSHSIENRVNKVKYRVHVEQDDPKKSAMFLIEKSKEIEKDLEEKCQKETDILRDKRHD